MGLLLRLDAPGHYAPAGEQHSGSGGGGPCHHCRRRFYEIHRATGSPLAEEALRRIGELYAIEAEARGRPPDERKAIRQERSRLIVDALHAWLTI